jgi:hypothetical protein
MKNTRQNVQWPRTALYLSLEPVFGGCSSSGSETELVSEILDFGPNTAGSQKTFYSYFCNTL